MLLKVCIYSKFLNSYIEQWCEEDWDLAVEDQDHRTQEQDQASETETNNANH